MSGLINKVKDALHSDKHHEQPEGTSGPHSSRAANTADPRVDSDRDHRSNPAGTHSTTGTHGSSGLTGSHGTTGTSGFGSSGTSGIPEGTAGPHSSRVANAADPRVDSDLDGSRNAGSRTTGTTGGYGSSGVTGSSGLTGSGTHGTTGTSGFSGSGTGAHGHSSGFGTSGSSGLPEGTTGPHSSRVANAADPRVDSDLDGSRKVGGHTGTTGTTGAYGTTGSHTLSGAGTHGTHGSSGIGGTGATGGAAGYGSGPAPKTAGPHKSDALNKADPRVDSDLDGSKTVGQDKTFAQSNEPTNFAGRDPTDATQVPPSILQKHIGEPALHHDNPHHDHAKRHSVSHQEEHRGL